MSSGVIYKDLYLTEKSFTDAREFMDAISEYYSRDTLMDFLGAGVARVIFRGIDDAKHENVPRAFRAGVDWSKFDFYVPSPLDVAGGYDARSNFLFDHRQVELRAVSHFLNAADKLGIPTPLNFYNLDNELYKALNIYRDIGYNYVDRAPRLDHSFPGQEVREAFALAQHYGVPTRLLDWTESPQVAMFFAAAAAWQAAVGCPRPPSETSDEGGIAVYGLGCHLIKKLGLSLVHAVRYQNPRLRAHGGLFLLDPEYDNYFATHGRWPSLEDRVRLLEEKENSLRVRGLLKPEARLVKWSLSASQSGNLAKLLLENGVAYETMFPSLESAALAFSYRQGILPTRSD